MIARGPKKPPIRHAPAYRSARSKWSPALDGGSPKPGGFTLVEVLVALCVVGILMGALYGSYRAIIGSIQDLPVRLEAERKTRLFVQCLSRQVRCCYHSRSRGAGRPVPEPNRVGAMDDDRQTPFFQGSVSPQDDVLLQFVTADSRSSRRSDLGYLTVVSYKLEPSQHTLLAREEIYGRQQENDDRDDRWRLVLENVSEIEFEYFDGEDWRTEWNSNISGSLPRALRVAFEVESTMGRFLHLYSVAPVLCLPLRGAKIITRETSAGAGKRDRRGWAP